MVKVKIFPANVDRTLYTGDGIIIVWSNVSLSLRPSSDSTNGYPSYNIYEFL